MQQKDSVLESTIKSLELNQSKLNDLVKSVSSKGFHEQTRILELEKQITLSQSNVFNPLDTIKLMSEVIQNVQFKTVPQESSSLGSDLEKRLIYEKEMAEIRKKEREEILSIEKEKQLELQNKLIINQQVQLSLDKEKEMIALQVLKLLLTHARHNQLVGN